MRCNASPRPVPAYWPMDTMVSRISVFPLGRIPHYSAVKSSCRQSFRECTYGESAVRHHYADDGRTNEPMARFIGNIKHPWYLGSLGQAPNFGPGIVSQQGAVGSLPSSHNYRG